MKTADVFIFTGGLDDAAPVFGAHASNGTPSFTRQSVHRDQGDLGGFAVVDVADEEAAQLCAGKDRRGLRLATRGTTFRAPGTDNETAAYCCQPTLWAAEPLSRSP
jgi:hypothetical protein